MKQICSVQFRIDPNPALDALLAAFRDMINDAIKFGLNMQPKSRYQLRNAIYKDLRKRYGLHSHYVHYACEVAFSILRKHVKWGRTPTAKHLMVKLDSESYWVNHLLLRMPTKPGEYLIIQLRGGDYQLSRLNDPSLKRGPVTITPTNVAIALSKDVVAAVPLGAVAYDVNLRNIVGVATSRTTPLLLDTSKIPRIIDQYREIVSKFRRKDVRVARRIMTKYGARESSKVEAVLHKVTKDIVSDAAKNNEIIVLENLKYIRNKHKRSSAESKRTREQLNKWSYRVRQTMIKYKAAWNRVPVEDINPRNSSKRCCVCGTVNRGLSTEMVWQCPNCGATLDRNVNAPINLLMTFLKNSETLRFGAGWLADEAMRRRVAATPSEEQMSASRQRSAESWPSLERSIPSW